MSTYLDNLHQISKEITLIAMEKGIIRNTDDSTDERIVESYAEQSVKFYQTVYKGLKECDK